MSNYSCRISHEACHDSNDGEDGSSATADRSSAVVSDRSMVSTHGVSSAQCRLR